MARLPADAIPLATSGSDAWGAVRRGAAACAATMESPDEGAGKSAGPVPDAQAPGAEFQSKP